nr:tyrosine-type recombinase/integrase [Conexibacter arvalis]
MADLSGAVLDVERAVSAGVEKEPKGRRGRQVPLPRPAAEALARLGRRDEFTGPSDYVFCNRYGARLDPSAIRRRYKRAAAAAGLRPVKLHGLRHAAGSVLARSLPLVTVRDVLGHAELRTTNRYLHSKIDPAAIVAVNAAFGVVESSSADVPASG